MRVRRWAAWIVGALLALAGASAAAGWILQAVFEREYAAFPAPGRLVAVDGARRLHVLCEGAGSPTVILEAGGTHFSTQYAQVEHALAAHTRVCAYDRAGMGWSDPSARPLDAHALASDLDALLVNASIAPPYVIVAGSAGGLTAELYAREHPDRVAALVLLDAVTGRMIDDLPQQGDAMAESACRARTLNRFGLLRLIDPLERRALEDRDLELALTYRRSTWDAICSLLEARHDSADQIRAAPPLSADLRVVIVRRDVGVDPAWQAAQARNAAMTRRGRLVVATGSGHHIVEDRPGFVTETVLAVLSELRLAGSGPDRP